MGTRIKNNETDSFKFSEGFMQEALSRFFAPNSIKYDLDGLYIFDWESDKILETKSGYIYEFEIKISRADFKNDFKHKKDKHIILEGEDKYGDKYFPRYYEFLEENRKRGNWCEENFIKSASNNPYYVVGAHKRPNYFYYATPPDLIKEEDVPEYAGLVYVNQSGIISIIKKAPRIHKDKINDAELNLGEKFYYNMVHWRNKFKKEKLEKEYAQNRLLEEIESKGQGLVYAELEQRYNELEKVHKEYIKSSAKIEDMLRKDLREQNMIVRRLVSETQKYNKEFDFLTWADENFGEENNLYI